MKKYQIIYADPPWSYADQGCQGTMANHYSGMAIEDICALPVESILDKNCILFLWATYPMLPEALQVIEAWGFQYKTIAFQWLKLNKKNWGWFYGLGRWTRGNTEPCLLATRGKPKRIAPDVFQIIDSPITKHSQKPGEVRKRIIKLVGDLPRIELFARQKTDGWDVWGNEIESDIVFGE
jgi:N6-adenosine-specific RNA methylase IME4